MKAADLTDEWIGRTVAVHCCRNPSCGGFVGRLRHIEQADEYRTTIRLLSDGPDEVHGIRAGERVVTEMTLPNDTVITDQEIPL